MMNDKFKTHLEEAITNIHDDRKIAAELLQDVAEYIGKNKERHKDVGQVAAKYLETLQRSNEQLVKLTGMLQKTYDKEFEGLTPGDKESLYDHLEAPKND